MARNEIAEKVITDAVCTFKFSNGVTLVCDPATLPTAAVDFVMGAGIRQLVGDAFSAAKTVDEAIAMAEAKWEALTRGDLRSRGESQAGIIAQAFVRVMATVGKALTVSEARDLLKSMDAKMRKNVEKDARILAAIADIRKEQANAETPMVDFTALV